MTASVVERNRLYASGMTVLFALFSCRGGEAQAVISSSAPYPAVVQQVNRQLLSYYPKEVAWGAYLASQNQLPEVVLLERALTTVSFSEPAELAVLDALIQLNASVSAHSLRPLFNQFPVQTLILLGNASGERDAVLLSLLESTSGNAWYASANMLLKNKAPGFARQLLTGLTLHLKIDVTDGGPYPVIGGRGIF